MKHASPHLQAELERHINERTNRRVRNLAVEFISEAIVLKGRASTYYVKQLAQQGVRDLLPQAPLRNAITVEDIN